MEWISAKDGFPEECETVLLYCKGMSIAAGYLICERNGIALCFHVNDWDESDSTIHWQEVSHWMKCPEPPKD